MNCDSVPDQQKSQIDPVIPEDNEQWTSFAVPINNGATFPEFCRRLPRRPPPAAWCGMVWRFRCSLESHLWPRGRRTRRRGGEGTRGRTDGRTAQRTDGRKEGVDGLTQFCLDSPPWPPPGWPLKRILQQKSIASLVRGMEHRRPKLHDAFISLIACPPIIAFTRPRQYFRLGGDIIRLACALELHSLKSKWDRGNTCYYSSSPPST